MTKRGTGRAPRVVGEWFAAALSCPRCGGPTDARTTAPKQVGLPWADEPPSRVEWRCRRPLDECNGPTLAETDAAADRLVPERSRAVDAPAGRTFTCTSCGAVWGRALPRCPVDGGVLVETVALVRSA